MAFPDNIEYSIIYGKNKVKVMRVTLSSLNSL